jgi:hypothetical protein
MVTGRRAFQRTSQASLITAIMSAVFDAAAMLTENADGTSFNRTQLARTNLSAVF